MGDVLELAKVLVLVSKCWLKDCLVSSVQSLPADSPFLSMVILTVLEILAIPTSSSLLLTVV